MTRPPTLEVTAEDLHEAFDRMVMAAASFAPLAAGNLEGQDTETDEQAHARIDSILHLNRSSAGVTEPAFAAFLSRLMDTIPGGIPPEQGQFWIAYQSFIVGVTATQLSAQRDEGGQDS